MDLYLGEERLTLTLNTNLAGLTLKNPLIMAAGTFGYGTEYTPYIDVSKLGALCSKGVTLHPKEGNVGPRIWETHGGILNSVGLQNPGIESFIAQELPRMRRINDVIIANLGGGTLEEYVQGATLLNQSDVDMIELNISCPNVKHGGMAFGIDSADAQQVVKEVRNVCQKPLMVKLSPNAKNIVEMAQTCEQAGADALSLVNTFKAMVIDIHKRKPVFRNVSAGLSGPAIFPIALRMVYEVCEKVSVPVVGIGGIESADEVIQYIMAGATAVQIGTANLSKPTSSIEILNQLEAYCEKEKIQSLEKIRGIAHQ